MKRTIKMFIFVALFCTNGIVSFGQSNGTSIQCSELPANPTPHMAINDFAGIIDANQKSAMESQLRSYWDSTSIAICIVTIPSLGGYDQFDYSTALFNCWGIGGKDNRGLLIFVALKEHKISIRTGYGLEAYITDAKSSSLISSMRPFFKKDQYTEGLTLCVNDIVTTLGTISWEDRMLALQQRKDAEAREYAELKEAFMGVVYVLGLLLILGVIIYQVDKSIRKARQKKNLSIFIDKIIKEIDKANLLLKDSLKSFSSESIWVKNEAEDHMRICQKSIDQASVIVENCSTSIVSDVNLVNLGVIDEKAQEAAMLLEKAFKSFTKMNSDLKIKVRKIESEAPLRLKEAQESLSKNSNTIAGLIHAGFNFDEAQSHQLAFEKKLADYSADIKNKERLSEIYTDSFIVKEKSERLINQLTEIIDQKKMIDTRFPQLVQDIKDIRQHYFEANKSLNILKKNYPEKVWVDFETRLNSDMSKLSFEKVEDTMKKINKLNSMEEQKFSEALSKFGLLVSLVDETAKNFNAIVNAVHEQDNARREYPTEFQSNEWGVAGVLKESKDSDVSSSTKTLAKGLAQKLSGVKISSEKTIVDWVGLIKLLNSIKIEASSVLKKIKSEIEDAERERKRKAEEARKRAEKSRISSSYRYDSGSSSSSVSSFGGFGGGGTGGGGADGGW